MRFFSPRHSGENDSSRSEMSTTRLEALSDGIFAIAITLLIIEVQVPHERGENWHLAQALGALWPSYFAFVLSFTMIGIYWANHHYIFRIYKRTNHAFILLNLFFLGCISFLPFPTAVLGEFITNEHERGAAVTFYAFVSWLCAIGWYSKWFYASRFGLIDTRLTSSYVQYMDRQYLASVTMYGVAFACSFIATNVALVISVGLTLLYLMPSRRPEYRQTHLETHREESPLSS